MEPTGSEMFINYVIDMSNVHDLPVQLLDFFMVTQEQLKEGGLCPRGALKQVGSCIEHPETKRPHDK